MINTNKPLGRLDVNVVIFHLFLGKMKKMRKKGETLTWNRKLMWKQRKYICGSRLIRICLIRIPGWFEEKKIMLMYFYLSCVNLPAQFEFPVNSKENHLVLLFRIDRDPPVSRIAQEYGLKRWGWCRSLISVWCMLASNMKRPSKGSVVCRRCLSYILTNCDQRFLK